MTSSNPSQSPSGLTSSYGVVVATTSGRPAARCSAKRCQANGCTFAASVAAAASPAARIAARERPLARAAAWRASNIDGSVSPMALNRPYSNRSPGMPRVVKPESRMASE